MQFDVYTEIIRKVYTDMVKLIDKQIVFDDTGSLLTNGSHQLTARVAVR